MKARNDENTKQTPEVFEPPAEIFLCHSGESRFSAKGSSPGEAEFVGVTVPLAELLASQGLTGG
jgi:hypothetical protein